MNWYPAPTVYIGRKCSTEPQQCSHLNRLFGALKCQQIFTLTCVYRICFFSFLPFSARAKRLQLVSKTPARCGAQFSHHLPHHSAKSRRLTLQSQFFVISIYNMSQYVSHSLLVNENCHPPCPPALISSTHLSFSLTRRRHTHTSAYTPPS